PLLLAIRPPPRPTVLPYTTLFRSGPGDRAAILASTRPEWTIASLAISRAGGVVVPVYPTNSPEECEWVAGNSEARLVVCEDDEQAGKIAQVRERLDRLEHVIPMDTLDDLRERGRGGDR